MPPENAVLRPVDRYLLQQAFAVAHRGARREAVNEEGRKRLRLIARLIWKAYSADDGPYKNRFATEVEATLKTFEREASGI